MVFSFLNGEEGEKSLSWGGARKMPVSARGARNPQPVVKRGETRATFGQESIAKGGRGGRFTEKKKCPEKGDMKLGS